MNIAAVNLNLLLAFHAMLEHRNVTRAGEAIGLSQPAMSSAVRPPKAWSRARPTWPWATFPICTKRAFTNSS